MSAAERIGDVDRERVAERLRTAAGEGRLTPEELEERLEAALSARTQADLAPLTADLPAEQRPRARRPRGDLRVFAWIAILLVAIWAFTGAGYFWPVWPILGWGAFVLKPRWVSLGPCHRSASSRPSTSR
jgi:fatty acid desaturase